MNADVAHELLNQLGTSIENLETQQAALLQFLKDEGVVTDERFASYLTQAGNASDVRWRAARVRLERLISAEKQKEEQLAEKAQHPAAAAKADAAQAPVQNQGEEAKSKSDAGSSEAAPQHEAAPANPATKSAEAHPAPEKDTEQK